MLATLCAGVCIPYGERRVTESASQVYFEGTHRVFLLHIGMSSSSLMLTLEGWVYSYPTFLVRY
jgi:hypothetical protein